MADPICRWRNSSVKQVVEFNLLFPLKPIERQKGRNLVEKNWAMLGGKDFFTTPYQLAAQMAIYYEDADLIYPRFDKIINLEEAYEYIQHWGRKYYAPNPYTKSMQQNQKPVVINRFLVNWVIEKGGSASFTEAVKEMFKDSIGNTDILINLINNFMDVEVVNDKVSLKDPSNAKKFSIEEVWPNISINDKKSFYEFVGETKVPHGSYIRNKIEKSRQIIFYGAPGTGKSYEIKRLTQDKEVIRTTFHPDSDYSTFVGAYKPTTIEVPVRDVTGKIIREDNKNVTENRIIYEFVEQAFLQAYIKAWKAYTQIAAGEQPAEQYLVIEEINRGNCAQIFGDLFQLLDRNSYGFSEYPITADKDMKKQLAKTFSGLEIADAERINKYYDVDMVSKVLSGEVLLLPDNLYIWATMNTSDQSLFPIDSAFKRRWEWKYIPISEGKTEMGESLGYKIEIKGKKYDWWTFLNRINNEIEEITKSEDKKLGYFFCKANDSVINADTFVSKVVFYLWNDVFKDQDASIFNDDEGEMTFSKFYDTDNFGKPFVKEDKVELLLQNLKVDPLSEDVATDNNDEENNSMDNDQSGLLSVELNGETIQENKSIETFAKVIEMIGPNKIAPLGLTVGKAKHELLSLTKIPSDIDGGYGQNVKRINEYWMLTKYNNSQKVNYLNTIAEKLNLDLKAKLI